MQTTKRKGYGVFGRSSAKRNAKNTSFRALKAFGIWRYRSDLKDPVQFTSEFRAGMERPINAR